MFVDEAGSHTVFEVGSPFPWPYHEGVHADLLRTGGGITVAMPSPTREEVRAYRKGKIRFAMHEGEHVLLLLLKVGDQPWLDAPFSAALIPSDEFEAPDLPTSQSRLYLPFFLVDSATGLLRVLRAFTLSPQLTRRLREIALRQREAPFSQTGYYQEIQGLYRNDTEALARRAGPVCLSR